ncbi:MAG: molybdate ABC transporter permease subunit [Burkholderiales bacterium]|nr:molybdate ABC transporter permease subunit [Burkholderiales bacterium]
MDYAALKVSLQLALFTLVLLLPLGLYFGRLMAFKHFFGKSVFQGLILLPLVLPPTVLGYYLLTALGSQAPLGRLLQDATGLRLVFNFSGLLLASVIFNIPFMLQPIQRAFESIPKQLREAAFVSGLSLWQTFLRVELPLAWPGIVSAIALTFVHTLGEFGVVMMLGGNIPGETRTLAIAIYDEVQAFNLAGAQQMSAALLLFSLLAVTLSFYASSRLVRR